jgi:acetyl-CoA carboxylase biotin carboxyl carrier protein
MDIRKVKKLIELLEESGIAEIEITEGEEAVRISRFPTAAAPAAPVAQATAPAAPPAALEAPKQPTADVPIDSPGESDEQGHRVLAPMVGTFYRASGPTDDPFVGVGDQINAGDTLCIIEAMKMMNQIEADVAGRVISIEAENGEPVEYGQLLFVIG